MNVTIFTLFIAFASKIYDPTLNMTVRFNSSCEECLCEKFISNNNIDYLALNCFLNGTCQFFQSFPSSYKIKSSSGTRLYFLQNKFPNASKCCMPNITDLLIRLKNAVPTTINLTFQPAAFGYDEAKPYEVAVTGWSEPILYWFNPITTMFIRNFSIDTSLTLTVYNNQTFTAKENTPTIYIRDSETNNYLGNISYSTLAQIRKLIFINNGRTAVVPTQKNNSLTIFDVNSSIDYTYQQQVLFPLQDAHGIAKVNDTFLYVSSWTPRSIVSYKYENSIWTYKIFFNYTATGAGSHLAVDECERVWFVNTEFGLRIYDPSGIEIANWNMSLSSSNQIYDILLLPNYILLVTHFQLNKIVRYDPQVTCS